MSSHHIVREKQEPALLILSLENFNTEYLGQLLEWSPTVIAIPKVAEQLSYAGIYIDYLLARTPEEVLHFPGAKWLADKHDDILGSGMDFLIGNGYPAVNVIIDNNGPYQWLPYINCINLVYYTADRKSYAIKSGYSKWYPAGSRIYISHTPVNLECKNVVMEKERQLIVITDGRIELIFSDGWLFLWEYI